ncbi:MAG: thermonuclease family protein [Pseudomonadota bacterium]
MSGGGSNVFAASEIKAPADDRGGPARHTLDMTPSAAMASADGTVQLDLLVRGSARVVDGDTIDVAGQRVRLEGIDAPESAQRCLRQPPTQNRQHANANLADADAGPADDAARLPAVAAAEAWRCGHAATRLLHNLIGVQDVVCRGTSYDRRNRLIGRCWAGARDLNAAIVANGLAWAFRKYSQTFIEHEARARTAGLGVWQVADPTPPWTFRAQRWAPAAQKAPAGCPIKGNISARGRVYHTPWSAHYARTRISPSRGERWFCSEAEALAAGWRAPRRG